MKGHKHHESRKHRADGGPARDDARKGTREWEEDQKDKPEARDNAHEIEGEAEAEGEADADERKRGGRAKRKRGGHVKKEVGHVEGHEAHKHAGRKPRRAGGRAGSDKSPLSSAHHGVLPPHHKDAKID